MVDLSFLELLSYIPAGFLKVLTPGVLVWLLAGVMMGFFIGLLPGLGSPVALAILIPFTFNMEPFPAFALLLGVISVAMTAGDITAVLFGIPGDPGNAATLIDGHAMAKNGEAGRALGAVLSASVVGAVLGALFLALAMVIVRPLVLSIGYAEMFMLSLAGITFLASLSSDAVFKGLAMGAMGILLSMIGLDPITAVERFTFGNLFLWDGIGFVPVILGVFAIPELIAMAEGRTDLGTTSARQRTKGALTGIRDTMRHIGLIFRCSALSTYIGMIPGMGASIAQWVAYGHAAQTARESDNVGRGGIRGILGPASANNATLSGGLIPTIAFGVPGTPQLAILLGAFIVHGLVPGPSMLAPEENGGHLTLTFAMVAMIIISNIVVVLASFVFLNQVAKVAYLRAHLLIPFVVVLVFVGAFATKYSLYSLVVTLLFGLLGWIMARLNWSRPALVLGVVLGPLIENSLFLSVSADGYAWMTRPSVLVIFALILSSAAYPFYKKYRQEAQQRVTAPQPSERPPPASPGLEWGNLALALVMILVFAYALVESRSWPLQSRLIPALISGVGIVFALVQAGFHTRALIRLRQHDGVRIVAALFPHVGSGARAGAFMWMVLVVVLGLIYLLGFVVALPIFLFVYLNRVARLRVRTAIGVVSIGCAAMYLIFFEVAKMPFPMGAIIEFTIERAPALGPYLGWTGV